MKLNTSLVYYGKRGMTLENDINITNEYYRNNNIALIYKKPTPIKILKLDYKTSKITNAFFETQSTLDYNGVVNGKYIEFDAKETKNKTSFPLSNIHPHQLEHIKKVIYFKGIVFLIIRFSSLNKDFIIMGNDLIDFININSRKSIPFDYINKKGIPIEFKYNPRLDYISALNKMEVLWVVERKK